MMTAEAVNAAFGSAVTTARFFREFGNDRDGMQYVFQEGLVDNCDVRKVCNGVQVGREYAIAGFKRGQTAQKDMEALVQLDVGEFIALNLLYPKIYTPHGSAHIKEFKEKVEKDEYFMLKSIIYLQTFNLQKARDYVMHGMKLFPHVLGFHVNLSLLFYLERQYKASQNVSLP